MEARKRLLIVVTVALVLLPFGCKRTVPKAGMVAAVMAVGANDPKGAEMTETITKVIRTDDEWKKVLTPEQYKVTVRKGTEKPFSSPLDKFYQPGTYECVRCSLPLFSSETKYDSGTGWPSFYAPISPSHIITREDRGFFASRTEALCARCESHMGHIFDDGPPPTGQRYCMNGVALKFVPKEEE